MTVTLNNLKTAKTAELLAFYNAHRTPIVKFRDRATAESRVAALLQELASKTTSNLANLANTTGPNVSATTNPIVAAVTTTPKNAKTYLEVIRDHSGSMHSLARAAARDFNATIAATQRASAANSIPTVASVTECGGGVRRVTSFAPIDRIEAMAESRYSTGGGTPLFKSVLQSIENLKRVPDYNNPEVTFIVMATTDGQDTDGGAAEMTRLIRELQNTDRWTFVFRVPRGYAQAMIRLGVEPGNILEWDQTERGVQASTQANDQAFQDFYTSRAAGVKSTRTFYVSSANVSEADVKKLGDISAEVSLWPVSAKENETQIRDFVESRLNGAAMLKGAAFYQLVKTEDKIQDYKLVAIRDKDSGQIYCGPEARDLIGLPRYGDARVRPDTAGKWQVFVQSTSVNRKVSGGTQLLYWPNVGKRFTEGKSAR